MPRRFIIVGGGSAGCVVANRLSSHPSNEVILLEAGDDTPPGKVPADIASPYGSRASLNPQYMWRGLKAVSIRGMHLNPAPSSTYEQACIMGGGSSINGQIATRGAPEDYERWAELGAEGWNWDSVLPHFRDIETDLDFSGDLHGSSGPLFVKRTPRNQWDRFTTAVADELVRQGYEEHPDINGTFEEGYSPIALNTTTGGRISAATAFLDASVRARKNLTIRTNTMVKRVVFDGNRAVGVDIVGKDGEQTMHADEIVLSAGAILTPALLLRSGIGPADHLRDVGIPLVAALPGVGNNLQDHIGIHVSAFLRPEGRAATTVSRHNSMYLRYRSALSETPDMLLNFACRSGWHAVGRRIGTIQACILKPRGRGHVRLSSCAPNAVPEIALSLVNDERDLARLKDAFRKAAAIMKSVPVSSVALNPFATSYSERVRRIGRPTLLNKLLTDALALILDSSGAVRKIAIDHIINNAPPIGRLLEDDDALDEHVRRTAIGLWHPAGTCRMGGENDADAVTDPRGRVRRVSGLRIADNSLMPEVPRANTSLPAMMIGARVSSLMLEELDGLSH